MLKNAKSDDEIKKIKERDIDNFYNENGGSMLSPYEMCERMYLVIKSIFNKGGVQQDYELQKGDIIKLGRAKFLVRDINIAAQKEKIQNRNSRIARHRMGYKMRKK